MLQESVPTLSVAQLVQPDLIENPYPFYHQLRATDPVHQDRIGVWVLSRYADVVAALHDPRFSADRIRPALQIFPEDTRETFRPLFEGISQMMLFMDPPHHTRLRGLINKAFTPRVVEAMRPQIQQAVDTLLDRVQEAGTMDVMADLAYPLPTQVIAQMLGVPEGDRDQMKSWSDDFVLFLGNLRLLSPAQFLKIYQSMQGFIAYFREQVAARRQHPTDDLLSALIQAEENGTVLSEEELFENCILLLAAGHETTINLIGNGLLALLRNPEQLRKLQEAPHLIGPAVEELLRYDSPVQFTGRVLTADAEIGGRAVAKGTAFLLGLSMANHDPARFHDPDRLDITRRDNRHLSFGYSAHFCVGAPLARLEGQIAINTVLRRMPDLALATDSVHHHPNMSFRGLRALPVRF